MTMFWWIFWVLAIAVFFVFVIPRGRVRAPRDPAIDELRRRYAAGEIDETQYRSRLAVLQGGAPPPVPPHRDETHAAV
jgi:uncharacterized membrane protein